MATKASYYHQAGRELRHCVQASQHMDAAGHVPSDADKKRAAQQRRQEARAARQLVQAQLFDSLQVGDNLEAFGLAAVVQKKNAKSVVTTLGVRWTRAQLCRA